MIKRKRVKRPLRKRVRQIFLFASVIALCLLLAAGISSDEMAENMELRLICVHENCLVMLLEDSNRLYAYYKDISAPDSTLTKAENIPESGRAYFLYNGTLGIAGCIDGRLDVDLYSLEEELKRIDKWCPFDFSPNEEDKLIFANVGTNTYTAYILSSDGNLRSCKAMFEPDDSIILSGVSFMDSTQGGWVYAYAGETLLRWVGDAIESGEEYHDAPCPVRLVGENVYIDETDVLVRIKNGTIERIDLNLDTLNHTACYGTDNYVIAADGSGMVHKYDWSGEDIKEVGTANIDGEILGITEGYILTKKDGQLYLEQLEFYEPDDGSGEEADPTPIPEETKEPTPTQSPGDNVEETPSPSQEPDATGTPDPDGGSSEPTSEATPTPPPAGKDDEVGKIIDALQFKELTGENGKYIAVLAGARVADLRKIYEPQSFEAFTQDGKPVFESILKTGMKIRIPLSDGKSEEISVIIRGDCDGDGKVGKSDISFASLYIINAVYAETDVQFMAMDMNDDGKVNIWDLPMIADETKRMG